MNAVWGRISGTLAGMSGLLDWLYPPVCVHCGASLLGYSGSYLCTECESKLSWLGHGCCRHCGAGWDGVSEGVPKCSRCPRGDDDFTRAVGVVSYKSPARELVHDFKYKGNQGLANTLYPQMLRRLTEAGFPEKYDIILPVPLHKQRLKLRGYNQSALLAKAIATATSSQYSHTALLRIRHTTAQALVAPRDRKENIAGAFQIGNYNFAGKTVLLVDDVLTTGSTAGECCRVMREAGANRIYVAVWAR